MELVMSFRSAAGTISAAVRDEAVVGMGFGEDLDWLRLESPQRVRRHWLIDALSAYFDGDMSAFDDVPLELAGTAFQMKVWEGLRTVPPGHTTSYRRLAEQIAAPLAVRAVGTAAGKNPIGIIVPCHRMLCSDGTLGGYAGGLDKKEYLLAHERKYA